MDNRTAPSPGAGSKAGQAKAAGVLSIISGALFVISALFGSFLLWALVKAFSGPGAEGIPFPIVAAFTMPMAVIGIVAIIGGVMATGLHKWGLALAGAICAIFCFFPLGITATVLVVTSRREFAR